MDDILDDNIEQMREYGIGLGLSDADIDACIYSSLSDSTSSPSPVKVTEKTSTSKSDKLNKDNNDTEKEEEKKPENTNKCRSFPRLAFRFLLKFTKFCFFGVLLLFGFYILSFYHEPTQAIFEKANREYSYPFLRLVRLASMPVWQYVDMSGYYSESCLVYNPFFIDDSEADIDCEKCSNIHKVVDVNNITAEEFLESYIEKFTPCRIQTNASSMVKYSDLQNVYRKNKHKLQKRDQRILCTVPGVLSFDQLLTKFSEEKLKRQKDVHVIWYAQKVGPAQLLRTLFPRPDFLPRSTEVTIEKVIYIDGPKSKPYTHFLPAGGDHWYVQGSGERTLVLIPLGKCGNECQAVQVKMSEGQMLYYPGGMWRVDSVPVYGANASQGLGISFLGAFL